MYLQKERRVKKWHLTKQLDTEKNTESLILEVNLLTERAEIMADAPGVKKIENIKISKDQKKLLTNLKRWDIIKIQKRKGENKNDYHDNLLRYGRDNR